MASSLYDSLKELVIAFIKLFKGEKEVCFSWEDEPGQNRWSLSLKEKLIELRVLEFKDTFSKLLNDKGKEVFLGYNDIIKLGRLIIRVYDGLKFQYGINGYEELWAYEYPQKEINQFKELFAEYKKKDQY